MINRLTPDQSTTSARALILASVRRYLAESAHADAVCESGASVEQAMPPTGIDDDAVRRIEIFRDRLESVGGHCVVTRGEAEAIQALNQIIASLPGRRIALSDAPLVSRLMKSAEPEIDEQTIAPGAHELFGYDIGITTAQAAIAETGTLVLESDRERHRLVSLMPPVHIAFINAADICATLGDALERVRHDGSGAMSRTITFITGPSRTADIELTLTIGVHGPKELHVIVIE